jgi:hypothetical protein
MLGVTGAQQVGAEWSAQSSAITGTSYNAAQCAGLHKNYITIYSLPLCKAGGWGKDDS